MKRILLYASSRAVSCTTKTSMLSSSFKRTLQLAQGTGTTNNTSSNRSYYYDGIVRTTNNNNQESFLLQLQQQRWSSTSSSSSIILQSGKQQPWTVYLSGEIHSNWRDVIAQGCAEQQIPVVLTSANTNHEDSDDCGAIILGMEEKRPNWDMISAKMNAIRTKTFLQNADIVVVRFGDKYKQWNAAMEAGIAYAYNKPLIVIHPPSLSHMLKEINATANVVCEHPEQVVQTLAYVINGILPKTPIDGTNFIPIADRLGKGNPNP